MLIFARKFRAFLNSNKKINTFICKNAVLVNKNVLSSGDTIFIKIYTTEAASPNAFYEIPLNLDTNSLNTNITTLTLGQMRNHLISLKNSNMDTEFNLEIGFSILPSNC